MSRRRAYLLATSLFLGIILGGVVLGLIAGMMAGAVDRGLLVGGTLGLITSVVLASGVIVLVLTDASEDSVLFWLFVWFFAWGVLGGVLGLFIGVCTELSTSDAFLTAAKLVGAFLVGGVIILVLGLILGPFYRKS